jgi:hypothetical protein
MPLYDALYAAERAMVSSNAVAWTHHDQSGHGADVNRIGCLSPSEAAQIALMQKNGR